MSYRLPPLVALRAFEAAARHLSFKAAAQELHVTPAAISQQIKLLETYLGMPLFERLPRALRLTEAGTSMLPKLREGFECLAASVAATRFPMGGGVINVNAPPSFAVRWLVPRLSRFQEAYPNYELNLSASIDSIDRRNSLAAQGGQETDPRDDETEVNIRFGHGRYPGYQVERVLAPDYVPACSPRLPSEQKPLRVFSDIRKHVLIHDETIPDLEERPTWQEWLRLADVGGVDAERGPHFNNQGLAIEAAIAGQGVVLVPKVLVSADVAAGRLLLPFDLAIPSRYAYYLVVSQAAAERPAARAFHDWLLQEARADQVVGAGT